MDLNPLDFQAHVHHYAASLSAAGRRFPGHGDPTSAKDALFWVRDWAGITQILEDEARGKAAVNSKQPGEELASAVVELRASLNGPILGRAARFQPTARDVWALAEQVDPEAARPAEALLCAMEGCDLVTAGLVRCRLRAGRNRLEPASRPIQAVAVA